MVVGGGEEGDGEEEEEEDGEEEEEEGISVDADEDELGEGGPDPIYTAEQMAIIEALYNKYAAAIKKYGKNGQNNRIYLWSI